MNKKILNQHGIFVMAPAIFVLQALTLGGIALFGDKLKTERVQTIAHNEYTNKVYKENLTAIALWYKADDQHVIELYKTARQGLDQFYADLIADIGPAGENTAMSDINQIGSESWIGSFAKNKDLRSWSTHGDRTPKTFDESQSLAQYFGPQSAPDYGRLADMAVRVMDACQYKEICVMHRSAVEAAQSLVKMPEPKPAAPAKAPAPAPRYGRQ
ncbi:hypothetical protein K2X30_15100 [bacterium]|jgi:hypothetical protein|nr:hypothetical protein [bacterium]